MLEKIIAVPVEYTASPPNLMLVGDKQKEVRLHLAGSRSDLDSINPSQLNVKVDLSKAAALITTPIYLESIYSDTSVYCKIIARSTFQPAEKRWPDVEVQIKVGN
jgi:hypothetical protein